MIRKLLRLGPAGWIDLVRAQRALLRWSFVRRSRNDERLFGLSADHGGSGEKERSTDQEALQRARELAMAVNRVARFGVVRARCLVRSLALQELLEREGMRGSRVRFGARKRAGEFEAHAWVEFQGQVIGDDPAHVETFSPFPQPTRLSEWERMR